MVFSLNVCYTLEDEKRCRIREACGRAKTKINSHSRKFNFKKLTSK